MNRDSGVKTVIIGKKDLNLSNEELESRITEKMEKPFVFFYFSDKGNHLVITTEKGIVKHFQTYLKLSNSDYRGDGNRPRDVSLDWFPHKVVDNEVFNILNKEGRNQDTTMIRVQNFPGRKVKYETKNDLKSVLENWRKTQTQTQTHPVPEKNYSHSDQGAKLEERKIPLQMEYGTTVQREIPKVASKYAGAIIMYKEATKKKISMSPITDSGSHRSVHDGEILEKEAKIKLFMENINKFDTKQDIVHLKGLAEKAGINQNKNGGNLETAKTVVEKEQQNYDTVIEQIEKFLIRLKKNVEFEYRQVHS